MTKYVLLTEERQQIFYIKDCARIFQDIWGGIIQEVPDEQMDFDLERQQDQNDNQ